MDRVCVELLQEMQICMLTDAFPTFKKYVCVYYELCF